eukprot:1435907-Rhodomonas_salina.1
MGALVSCLHAALGVEGKQHHVRATLDPHADNLDTNTSLGYSGHKTATGTSAMVCCSVMTLCGDIGQASDTKTQDQCYV